MKKTLLIKVLAAVLVLIGCVVAQRVNAEIIRKVTVHGTNGQILNIYEVSDVDYFEFEERVYPFADFAVGNKDNIVFHLSKDVSFKMIKVQGGTYALRGVGTQWTSEQKTRTLSDYYIAEFECTQGLWKAVMGSVPSEQSATGDDMPVSMVSWDMIMGSANDTFLKLLDATMSQIKANSAADVVAALGNKEFRLPNEWEWEYAAAGGQEWASLNYNFCGTSGKIATDLENVAVNSWSPNKATSVAVVGSKLPNNLGLYDMSGNVAEWCSGLGYSGHETTAGYMSNTGSWNSTYRPCRGGGWRDTGGTLYLVTYRANFISFDMQDLMAFRLAL
ncbi:MAG: formylglycine-generating enzyme family protein [Muribaculaceae bacterium]|nr:formylglycine-generating enzyme family protein [Muribaculaceae bacterium]